MSSASPDSKSGTAFVLSRYVIPVPGPDDSEEIEFLYSSLSNSFLEITDEVEEELRCMAKGALNPASKLAESGFAVDRRLDELGLVRGIFEAARTSRDATPCFTIAPTMDCNFGCEYCFESHTKGVMPEPTQDALLEFFASQVNQVKSEKRSAYITWFGGEPLMGLKAIRRMMKHLDDWGRQESVALSANIITNGYLLGPQVSRSLIDMGVRAAQITLDGPAELHDSRRSVKGSRRPTFSRICENIAEIPEEMRVDVRVNVDRSSVSGVIPLYEELERRGLLRRVNVDVARVERFSPGPVPDSMFSSREFVDVMNDLYDTCEERGWPVSYRGPRGAVHGVCQVDSPLSWVVDWNGDLRKCWAELGTAEGVIGNVKTYGSRLPMLDACRLASRDPFDDAGCRECSFLPACMGGCPKSRMSRRAAGEKECPTWKFNFERVLATRAQGEHNEA